MIGSDGYTPWPIMVADLTVWKVPPYGRLLSFFSKINFPEFDTLRGEQIVTQSQPNCKGDGIGALEECNNPVPFYNLIIALLHNESLTCLWG